MQDLKKLEKEAEKAIIEAADEAVLRDVEIKFLGRKGTLTSVLRGLKDLSEKKRRELGPKANTLRVKLETSIGEKRYDLRKKELNARLKKEWIDISRPGIKTAQGHLHPLTASLREITSIFHSLGFDAVVGPEIETEWYNFDALNIPSDHPARDLWDTFWLRQDQKSAIKEKLLLRTHTSPVQIRFMGKNQPPLRIIVPGKVFRNDASDATHDIEFYQVEGLMVDKEISVANFKEIIQVFFEKFFSSGGGSAFSVKGGPASGRGGKEKINIRLRPSFFPFTEPSFEIDLKFPGSKRWLEVAGAGMVHPNVFKNSGLNPKHWRGFAFGFGVDRLCMMKYKISDIRLLHSSDPRFLKQF